MACLDTSFLLDLSGRGGKDLQRRARQKIADFHISGEVLSTTRFTVAELWVGIERSREPARETTAVEQLLAPLLILDFDGTAARVFGRLVARLQSRGQSLGDMDALIAAVCLVHGHSIVTNNIRHFERIPDLRVESY